MDRFALSNEEVNEYGFWILMSGVDLKHFIANPIMLYEHESYNEKEDKSVLPIGKWTDIYIKDGVLSALPVFDEKDSFAEEVKRKVEDGFLSATSVGFRPYEFSNDPKFLKKGQTHATVIKSRIKEASFVKFPGNLSALRLYDKNNQLIQLSDDKGLDAFLPLLYDQNFELNMEKIAMQFGLPKDASEEQIIKAINQLKDERIEMLLNHGKERGVLNDNNLDKFRKLAQSDFETTRDLILSETPPAKPHADKKEEKEEGKKVTTELSVAELLIQMSQNGGGSQLNDRSNWTFNDWEEKDPKGLAELQLSDTEKFEKLASTYSGRKYQ